MSKSRTVTSLALSWILLLLQVFPMAAKCDNLYAAVEKEAAESSAPAISVLEAAVVPQEAAVAVNAVQALQETAESEKKLQNLAESQNVTLDFKDADIRNVLRIVSYKSGVNIVATPEVIGNVSIRLTDIPWEKALDTIVTTYGFGYEWLNNKVIMVSTLEKLSQQRRAQEEAASKEPLDTQTFALNYCTATDIKATVEKLISPRGKITLETRTNMLIITETKSNLIKIAEIIKSLDKMTPQVMIEAKIIETTLGSAERLGIDWQIQASLSGSTRPTTFPFSTDDYKGDFNKMFPKVESPSSLERVTTTSYSETGVPLSTTTTEQLFHTLERGFPDASNSLFTFGTLSFDQTKIILEILDQRTDTKVLSNPRITTLNNQQARILVGSVVPIPNYEYSKDTGTRVVSGYTDQQIGIGLTVTPNINEQKYITLNVKPAIDQITGFTGPNNERPIISTRNAETNVMVKDGQTLVIGGLIAEKKIKYKKKVPILGDIPVLDYIFSKKEDSVDRTELLIFITPHIVTGSSLSDEMIAKLRSFEGPQAQDKAVQDKKKRRNKK